MGRGKRREPLFPLPIVPRALSFSFSPASPQHKESSAEERVPEANDHAVAWFNKADNKMTSLTKSS